MKLLIFTEGTIVMHKGGVGRTRAEIVKQVEDDCESIGGADSMAIAKVAPDLRAQIHSISVKEFGGIDHLPSDLRALQKR
jgi:hypothetical protein